MNYLSEVGWSNPGCFGTDDTILAKMVRQYHMALEIMRAFPEAPFGPTVVCSVRSRMTVISLTMCFRLLTARGIPIFSFNKAIGTL